MEGEEEADLDDVDGRSDKRRKPNPEGEVEGGGGLQKFEEGEEEGKERAEEAEAAKEEEEEEDPVKAMHFRRDRIVKYYNQGTCHTYPTSYVLLGLTSSSRFSGSAGMLWMAMVGGEEQNDTQEITPPDAERMRSWYTAI